MCLSQCQRQASPLDFIYDRELGRYDIEKYASDAELLERVRTGTTENIIYGNVNGVIKMDLLFSEVGLEPANFYQNQITGENRIEKAKVCRFELETQALREEDNLKSAVRQFNREAKHLNAHVAPPAGYKVDFRDSVGESMQLIYIAVVLLTVYLVLAIGSCSPIHCRLLLAIWGIIVVLLSTVAGHGLCFALGWKATNAN